MGWSTLCRSSTSPSLIEYSPHTWKYWSLSRFQHDPQPYRRTRKFSTCIVDKVPPSITRYNSSKRSHCHTSPTRNKVYYNKGVWEVWMGYCKKTEHGGQRTLGEAGWKCNKWNEKRSEMIYGSQRHVQTLGKRRVFRKCILKKSVLLLKCQ